MHIVLAVIGALTAIYFFFIRAKDAADMASDVVDMANDVRLAARRFGFKRRTNLHPVESIDDPNLAISAIALSFLELDELPTQDQRDNMIVQTQSILSVSKTDAEEMIVLARWFMTECGGASPAISRITRRLNNLGGADNFEPLMGLIKAIVPAGGLSAQQTDALDDIKRAFRIR